jgi:hypothetical protein
VAASAFTRIKAAALNAEAALLTIIDSPSAEVSALMRLAGLLGSAAGTSWVGGDAVRNILNSVRDAATKGQPINAQKMGEAIRTSGLNVSLDFLAPVLGLHALETGENWADWFTGGSKLLAWNELAAMIDNANALAGNSGGKEFGAAIVTFLGKVGWPISSPWHANAMTPLLADLEDYAATFNLDLDEGVLLALAASPKLLVDAVLGNLRRQSTVGLEAVFDKLPASEASMDYFAVVLKALLDHADAAPEQQLDDLRGLIGSAARYLEDAFTGFGQTITQSDDQLDLIEKGVDIVGLLTKVLVRHQAEVAGAISGIAGSIGQWLGSLSSVTDKSIANQRTPSVSLSFATALLESVVHIDHAFGTGTNIARNLWDEVDVVTANWLTKDMLLLYEVWGIKKNQIFPQWAERFIDSLRPGEWAEKGGEAADVLVDSFRLVAEKLREFTESFLTEFPDKDFHEAFPF